MIVAALVGFVVGVCCGVVGLFLMMLAAAKAA